MWFEIGELDNSPFTPLEEIYGCFILDGQSIKIEVFFDRGAGIYFNATSDFDIFTRGICTFIRVPKWIFDNI